MKGFKIFGLNAFFGLFGLGANNSTSRFENESENNTSSENLKSEVKRPSYSRADNSWAVDYYRDLAAVQVQRGDIKSRYAGVSRIHCGDGYVDIRATRSQSHPELLVADKFECKIEDVNGLSVEFSVSEFLAWARLKQIDIYDYHQQ